VVALVDASRIPDLAGALADRFASAGYALPWVSQVVPGPGAGRERWPGPSSGR
jgi:hypothetical protein